MWTIFKIFIEFVTILLLFYALDFCTQGMWDFSSPTRNQTCTACIGKWGLNQWTIREAPKWISWWKIFYRQKAGGGLDWGFLLGKPQWVLLGYNLALPWSAPPGVSALQEKEVSTETGRRPQESSDALYFFRVKCTRYQDGWGVKNMPAMQDTPGTWVWSLDA